MKLEFNTFVLSSVKPGAATAHNTRRSCWLFVACTHTPYTSWRNTTTIFYTVYSTQGYFFHIYWTLWWKILVIDVCLLLKTKFHYYFSSFTSMYCVKSFQVFHYYSFNCYETNVWSKLASFFCLNNTQTQAIKWPLFVLQFC